MTDLSELLLKYFLTSLNLIEVEPRGNAEETNNKEVMKMLNEGYIPLFSAEKIKFIKNLSPVYAQLKDMADAIFNELNIRTELPASYKVAIALQLSILETWRKVIVEKAMLDERIVIDEENKLDISPYALLLLYRFIAISKFMCTGNEIVKLFSKVLETQKEDNAIVDIKRLEEYIEKKRQDRNEQRRAYTMYNTLFAPLILSYALSGASLLKYYRGLTQNQLSYTSTTLMEILESYFFRVIYDDNRSTLISLAKELVDYFSVLHEIVSNKELKSIIKEGSLYSYVLSKANERGITDMSKISVIWGLINDAVIAALVSLELYDNEELKTAYRNLVGDITIYEYVIKYPQKNKAQQIQAQYSQISTVLCNKGSQIKVDDLYLPQNNSLNIILSSVKNGNVLFIGPPGTGKTTLAIRIAEGITGNRECYQIVTANALWFRRHLIGGESLEKETVVWKSGLLLQAYVKASKIKDGYYFIIIDELNRADIDKAFGELFTIFSSPSADDWSMPNSIYEEIERYGDNIDEIAREFKRVYSKLKSEGRENEPLRKIRVIGTLNLIDARNLFYVGDALTRRFVTIQFEYPKDVEDLEKFFTYYHLNENEKQEIRELVMELRQEFGRSKTVKFNISPASLRIALKLYSSLEERDINAFINILKSTLGTLNQDVIRMFDNIVEEYEKKKKGIIS